jgi:hypothetical protein
MKSAFSTDMALLASSSPSSSSWLPSVQLYNCHKVETVVVEDLVVWQLQQQQQHSVATVLVSSNVFLERSS